MKVTPLNVFSRIRTTLTHYTGLSLEQASTLAEHVPLTTVLSCATLVLIGRLLAFIPVFATALFVDKVIILRRSVWVYYIVVAVLGSSAAQYGITCRLSQIVLTRVQAILLHVRSRLFKHAMELPISYYDGIHNSTLYTRIVTDLESLRGFLGVELAELFGAGVTSVVALVIMFRIDAALATLSAVLMGLATTVSFKEIAKTHWYADRQSAAFAAVANRTWEAVAGLRVVKAYHAEDSETARFASLCSNFAERGRSMGLHQGKTSALSTLLVAAVSVSVLPLLAMRSTKGQLGVADFILYTMALAQLSVPLLQLVTISIRSIEACQKVKGLAAFLRVSTEQELRGGCRACPEIEGTISFEDVSFSFNAEMPVLKNISFTTRPGELLGIVGPSGAGKSTLINLLCGFLSPASGSICVDGHDLADLNIKQYRRQVGLALQDTFLFEDTVRHNILIAKPDANDAELYSACRSAGLDEVIKKLPEGIDTLIGQNGNKLSGGERQRIALARAVLSAPTLLLLDEINSNLDAVADVKLQQAILELTTGRSTILVAHRLSAIQAAQQILVLDNGQIVQRGTHNELLAEEHGLYAELYRSQHSGFF